MNNPRTRVYLDLECTIIDIFQVGNLMNVDRIKKMLNWFQVYEVGIFSFAIYNDADRRDFDRRLAPPICEALGVKILLCPSIQDMMKADYQYTGVHYDPYNGCEMSDWISIRGKEGAFKYWMLNQSRYWDHAVLIDDVVPNLTMQYHDQNFQIEFVNVDSYVIPRVLIDPNLALVLQNN